jgi:hypothetical protein
LNYGSRTSNDATEGVDIEDFRLDDSDTFLTLPLMQQDRWTFRRLDQEDDYDLARCTIHFEMIFYYELLVKIGSDSLATIQWLLLIDT